MGYERDIYGRSTYVKPNGVINYALSAVDASSLTFEQLANLDANPELALKIEAFASRFARLQDTLGDKLLPSWLKQLGEPVGAVIDKRAWW